MTDLTRTTQLSWRRFMMTAEGQQGMLILREKIPDIRKGTSEEIIFSAGVNQGFRQCLDTISEMIAAEITKTDNLENP